MNVVASIVWSLSLFRNTQCVCALTGLVFPLLNTLIWWMHLVLVNNIWTGVIKFCLVKVIWIWLIIFLYLGHIRTLWLRSSNWKWSCLRHTLQPCVNPCELHLAKVFPNWVFTSSSLALKSSNCFGKTWFACFYIQLGFQFHKLGWFSTF